MNETPNVLRLADLIQDRPEPYQHASGLIQDLPGPIQDLPEPI